MSALSDPQLKPTVGIVIPVLNEASYIGQGIAALRRCAMLHEIIVVDGGSDDGTDAVVRQFAQLSDEPTDRIVRLVAAPRARALQMNAGAALARSDVLLFLHADTQLPVSAVSAVRDCIKDGELWGRFDVRLNDRHFLFRVIERLMNLRSALTGIATGDQAIFVRRDVFRMLGGYASIPLMEDVEFCKRLKSVGRPALIRDAVIASARRWRRHGIIRTVIVMWCLRLLYWLGVAPQTLARLYKDAR